MIRYLTIALLLAAAPAAPLRAQQPSAADGRQLYLTYCASCHGGTGVGNGPVAAALKKPPANLTLFSLGNGGTFPAERLRRVIDGRGVVAHGTPEMPVWGAVFKTPGKGVTDAQVRTRIDAILAYLESIQMRRGH